MKTKLLLTSFLLPLIFSCQKESVLWLNDLELVGMTSGMGSAKSNQTILMGPLTISRQVFDKGIGTHAVSTLMLELNGHSSYISGEAGIDDTATDKASVNFLLIGDHKILWESGIMHVGDSAIAFKVGINKIKKLGLLVTDAGDGIEQDYANWVDVNITYRGYAPTIAKYIMEEPYIMTPPPPAGPRMNGPKIYGVRPGSPFLYRIPCTGERPIIFSATSLPEELILDPNSGIITGKITKRGTYRSILPDALIGANR